MGQSVRHRHYLNSQLIYSPVRLDIDTPLLGVEAVGGKGTVTAKVLHLIHNFITTIVPGTRETLSVLQY